MIILLRIWSKNQKQEVSLPTGWKNLTYEDEDPEKANRGVKYTTWMK